MHGCWLKHKSTIEVSCTLCSVYSTVLTAQKAAHGRWKSVIFIKNTSLSSIHTYFLSVCRILIWLFDSLILSMNLVFKKSLLAHQVRCIYVNGHRGDWVKSSCQPPEKKLDAWELCNVETRWMEAMGDTNLTSLVWGQVTLPCSNTSLYGFLAAFHSCWSNCVTVILPVNLLYLCHCVQWL